MGRGFVDGQCQRLRLVEDWRQERRDIHELMGVCKGILGDDQVNEAEVGFLVDWFETHRGAVDRWPGSVLLERLRAILADDVLECHELEALAQTMRQFVAQEDHPDLGALASKPPFLHDPPPPIVFTEKTFVFTGDFLFGTRSCCEREVAERGGIARPSVSRRTDYVVVGTIASPLWAHGKYGTKVDAAIGLGVPVVSEEHWTRHL